MLVVLKLISTKVPHWVHTKKIFGVDTYIVGESSNILVILTDIFGHRYNNVLLVADAISKSGYKVLIPDILNGDPLKPGDDFQPWLPKHTLKLLLL